MRSAARSICVHEFKAPRFLELESRARARKASTAPFSSRRSSTCSTSSCAELKLAAGANHQPRGRFRASASAAHGRKLRFARADLRSRTLAASHRRSFGAERLPGPGRCSANRAAVSFEPLELSSAGLFETKPPAERAQVLLERLQERFGSAGGVWAARGCRAPSGKGLGETCSATAAAGKLGAAPSTEMRPLWLLPTPVAIEARRGSLRASSRGPSVSKAVGGTSKTSRAITTRPETAVVRSCGCFAITALAVGFCTGCSAERGSSCNLTTARRALCRAALPQQLLVLARRLASARARGHCGRARLRRAGFDRRMLRGRRRASAYGGQRVCR